MVPASNSGQLAVEPIFLTTTARGFLSKGPRWWFSGLPMIVTQDMSEFKARVMNHFPVQPWELTSQRER